MNHKILKLLYKLKLLKSGNGLKLSPEDDRDYTFAKTGLKTGTAVSVDLRGKFDLSDDQEFKNSCTAHCVGEMLEYFLRHKKKVRNWEKFNISKSYLWYSSRYLEGTSNKNSGVILRDVFKAIKKYGFTTEDICPLSLPYNQIPSVEAFHSASYFNLYLDQLPNYYRLSENSKKLSQAEACLKSELPVVFAFPQYSNYFKITRQNPYYDELDGSFRGYHGMLLVGSMGNYFIVKQSYGMDYSKQGYFFLKKELFQEHALDCWTLKD